jgi:hypothetical protein
MSVVFCFCASEIVLLVEEIPNVMTATSGDMVTFPIPSTKIVCSIGVGLSRTTVFTPRKTMRAKHTSESKTVKIGFSRQVGKKDINKNRRNKNKASIQQF